MGFGGKRIYTALARVAVGLTALVLADLSAGLLYRRVAGESFYYQVVQPDRGKNRRYRTRSDLYHHDLRKNVEMPAVWGDEYFVYTNSLGFRDGEVRDVPLQADGERILLIGDSFAEGVRVEFEATLAGRLGTHFRARGIDVLNAGVSSYSPSIYARKVRHLIEDVQLEFSRLIVLLDISDIEDEAKDYTVDADGNVTERRDAFSQGIERAKEFLRDYSVLYGTSRLFERESPPRPPEAQNASLSNPRGRWTIDDELYESWGRRGLRQAAKEMDGLAALLRVHDIALTVVVYPWPIQIRHADLDSRQVRFWREWSRTHDAQFVDLFPSFISSDAAMNQRAIDEFFITHDFHWNEAGHRHAAEQVIGEIESYGPRFSGSRAICHGSVGRRAGRPARRRVGQPVLGSQGWRPAVS